ncbi:uncharacterized protein LOC109850584 [Asparagus officinalis]|uniref:uncharacterized protein LOC109850584 n=1 Tax=Asparagus officinalis TaxID=4686 RepID=UPI00098E1F05|nr:uncharacterized protein LOC109850584 [Asparagus officinalis]
MAKLIFYGGTVRLLPPDHLAGHILFDHHDRIICHAGSFFIGRPLPILSLDEKLVAGETYFVLPLDRFPSTSKLTTASVAMLSSSKNKPSQFPFEYVRSKIDGRLLIRVLPEFLVGAISGGSEDGDDVGSTSPVCTTPELRKHYEQLVGSRERTPWSPKLETITERRPRSSPVRLLGLERLMTVADVY